MLSDHGLPQAAVIVRRNAFHLIAATSFNGVVDHKRPPRRALKTTVLPDRSSCPAVQAAPVEISRLEKFIRRIFASLEKLLYRITAEYGGRRDAQPTPHHQQKHRFARSDRCTRSFWLDPGVRSGQFTPHLGWQIVDAQL